MGWKCVNHFKTEIIITKNKKIKVNRVNNKIILSQILFISWNCIFHFVKN